MIRDNIIPILIALALMVTVSAGAVVIFAHVESAVDAKIDTVLEDCIQQEK